MWSVLCRYIEIFRSSLAEVRAAISPKMRPMVSGPFSNRPAPYDRNDRFGGANRFNNMGRGGGGGGGPGGRSFKNGIVPASVSVPRKLCTSYCIYYFILLLCFNFQTLEDIMTMVLVRGVAGVMAAACEEVLQ